jgi:uncharacterized integral membrane protein (TIGR00697 family)
MSIELENKKNNLFIILGGFFLTNAIIAEFIGAKIFSLEKTLGIPFLNFTILGTPCQFNMTAGVILWPFVFIMTDIINEYYGKKGVQKLTYIAVIMLIYSFIMVRVAMGLDGADFWMQSGSQQGITNMTSAYNSVFGAGLMIILGSLVAFLVFQVSPQSQSLRSEMILYLQIASSQRPVTGLCNSSRRAIRAVTVV